MKRLLILTITAVLLLGAAGCGSPKGWNEKDFVFYDEGGKAVLEPSAEYDVETKRLENNSFIALSRAGSSASTYRGVKIGDPILTAFENYDLTDSTYSIYKNSTYQKELIDEYMRIAPTGAEIINYAKEIDRKGMHLYIEIKVYKQNGKLCTYSKLKDDGIDIEKKLKYRISFGIDDMRIDDVYIDSNYHYEMYAAMYYNDGIIPEDEEYDWLRELGK
jgi:hypothetical protein